eukprot:315865_1
MFNDHIYIPLLIIYTFLSRYVLSSTYYVSKNKYTSYTCPDGPTGTCNIYCDYNYGVYQRELDCASAGQCNIYCTSKKCAQYATITASNSNNLNIIATSTSNECVKKANIYVPNYGNASFDDTTSKRGLRGIRVYAGTNTQNIIINVESPNIAGDDVRDMKIYASTAEYVHITLSNALEWQNGYLECPVNSPYNGPNIAPCILDASNGNGIINSVEIIAPDGIPKNVYIYPGRYQGTNTIKCTNVDALNGKQIDISYSPFDKSSDCWWTRDPTMDPTTDPTIDPTIDPTTDPTFDPTKDPTYHPTTDPTTDPTLTPTNTPTSPPTHAPSNQPTLSPTNSPTLTPTTSPTNFPTKFPTIAPTFAPTNYPTSAPTTPPSNTPSFAPSSSPSFSPTIPPTKSPSISPSLSPSLTPSISPSISPSITPSISPSISP